MSFTWFAIEAFLAGLLVIITANRWGRRFSGCLGLCLLTLFSCIFILVKSGKKKFPFKNSFLFLIN